MAILRAFAPGDRVSVNNLWASKGPDMFTGEVVKMLTPDLMNVKGDDGVTRRAIGAIQVTMIKQAPRETAALGEGFEL